MAKLYPQELIGILQGAASTLVPAEGSRLLARSIRQRLAAARVILHRTQRRLPGLNIFRRQKDGVLVV